MKGLKSPRKIPFSDQSGKKEIGDLFVFGYYARNLVYHTQKVRPEERKTERKKEKERKTGKKKKKDKKKINCIDANEPAYKEAAGKDKHNQSYSLILRT